MNKKQLKMYIRREITATKSCQRDSAENGEARKYVTTCQNETKLNL